MMILGHAGVVEGLVDQTTESKSMAHLVLLDANFYKFLQFLSVAGSFDSHVFLAP